MLTHPISAKSTESIFIGVSGISLSISNAYFILHRVFAYIQSNIKILKNNNTIKHSYFKLFVRFLSVKVTNSESNRNFLNQFCVYYNFISDCKGVVCSAQLFVLCRTAQSSVASQPYNVLVRHWK